MGWGGGGALWQGTAGAIHCPVLLSGSHVLLCTLDSSLGRLSAGQGTKKTRAEAGMGGGNEEAAILILVDAYSSDPFGN